MMKISNMVILSILCFFSCNRENDQQLYSLIVYDPGDKIGLYDYNRAPIIVPIYSNQDSVYCCLTPGGFYDYLNINIVTREEFTRKLYDSIINNKYIRVSDAAFKMLKNDSCIVVPDNQIKQIYEEEGLNGVIKEYVNKYGEISYEENSLSKINYIYYLCFINNIYFYWEDEGGPGYFLDNTILNQIKKNSD